MRVVFVLAGLGAGGAERVVALIATQWAKLGWACTIIAFDQPGDRIYHALHPDIDVIRLGRPRALPLTRIPGRVTALRRAIRASRPNLVISFLTKINVLTLLATRGLGIPVVVSERNNPARQDAHPAWNLALSILYRCADAIVMQTEDSMKCLPASVRSKASVIPNPIAAPRVRQIEPQHPVLVAVGRLTAQKGFDLLLTAFKPAVAAHPAWRLVIWGDGPERDRLENQIKALGLQDHVAMPGVSRDHGGWAVRASAFVLSSRYEGYPNALGEAMALGLPVISTACDFGPADMIVDGENGLLVAPNDSGALAHGIERIMRDAALRQRLGQSAKSLGTRCDPDHVVGYWSDLVSRLVVGSPRPANTRSA